MALAATLAAAASTAWAQSVPSDCPPGSDCITGLSAQDLLSAAARGINAGDTATARQILDGLVNLTPAQETERAFLLGLAALAEEDYARAIARFRAILADQPELQRVRLELARALFLDGQDRSADYHFRLVLADGPPEGVALNIQRFLAAIRERRVWSFQLEGGIMPDSNANAAPDDEQVELFGLPFDLSEDAQETGGVGFAVSGRIGFRPRLSRDVRLNAGISGRHVEFSGGDFDDSVVYLDAGPEFRLWGGSFLPSFLYFHRWFGGDAYNGGPGLRLSWQGDVTRTWSLQANGEWRQIDNKVNDGLDGPYFNGGVLAQQRLDNRSYATYRVSIARQTTEDDVYSYWEPTTGLGYGREFAGGITAYGEVTSATSFYDAPQAAFGETRRDVRLNTSLNLVKRDWNFYGFAPVLRLSYTRNFSNIDFYEYDRLRGEFTVTRTF